MTECRKLMYHYVCDVDECPNESTPKSTPEEAEFQAIKEGWLWVHMHEDHYYHLCLGCASDVS